MSARGVGLRIVAAVLAALLLVLVPLTSAAKSCPPQNPHCANPSPTVTVRPTPTAMPTASPTATPTSAATPTPVPGPAACPADRVLLESQAWWSDTGLTPPSVVGEHMHVAACFPRYGPSITGTLHLDLRILLHNLAVDRVTLGRLRVNWRVVGSNGVAIESSGGLLLDRIPGPTITRDASGNGTAVIPVDLNLNGLPSATIEIRVNPMAYPDNEQRKMLVAGGWQLVHGAPSTSTPHVVGKGWYAQGHDYQNAVFKSGIPSAPVSGIWCFTAGMNPGGGGEPTVLSIATWDPRYHDGYGGREIVRRSGPFSGQLCTDTRLLTNGLHNLVLLASDGQLAGVLNEQIEVQN